MLGTKTVWVLNAKRTSAFRKEQEQPASGPAGGSTLEDADYLEFALDLRAKGFEIAWHGVSEGNSTRQETIEGFDRFRSIFGHDPHVAAFHQTNIENLYCGASKLDSRLLRLVERLTDRSDYQGDVEDSPYFWGDIARDRLRYVRLPFHTLDEVNTLRVNPLMPFHDPRRPYVRAWFASSDGADVTRFNRLLSKVNLDRLEAQRGACVIYTHFAKGFAKPGRGLDPTFVAIVQGLAARPNVWLTTASELLDRLVALRHVSLAHDGFLLRVSNCGSGTIDGLTLRTEAGVEVWDSQDRPLVRSSGQSLLPCLTAGSSVTLRTSVPGKQSIAANGPDRITRREHRRIEYRNYVGLFLSAAQDFWESRRRR